jgi:hypothetical protein
MGRMLQRAAVWTLVMVALTVSSASAFSLRLPQVIFQHPPLQGYLNLVDPGINVATDQLDAQTWAVSVTGNTDFTLTLENGAGTVSNIGVYNGNDPNPLPVLFQVFPAPAVAGWYAALHFSAVSLTVSLFDQNNVFQGQTVYPGVNRNNFGFYIQGPTGLWFSQDFRNPPPAGHPQVLTYQSNLTPGDYWECFEAPPYDPSHSTFDGVVLNLQSVRPTPARSTSWGKLKTQYR